MNTSKNTLNLKQHSINHFWKFIRKVLYGLLPLGTAFLAFMMSNNLDMLVPGGIAGLVLAFLLSFAIPNPKNTLVEDVADEVSDVSDLLDD